MCAEVERPIPQTKWPGRLHALPRGGLASIWLGSRSQNPQLATAGPVSSFLFHLPAAGLLTNSYRNRAAPSGSRVPEESPQRPGNADRVLTRGACAAVQLTAPARPYRLLAATLSKPGGKRRSSSPRTVGAPFLAAASPRVTGL